MSVVKEFREFIARGNVIDLAVGVIIGAAFNGIVKSLVDQVIMPPIGLLTGGLDFSKLEWVLRPEDPASEAIEKVAIQYGAFVNTVIQFFIVATVVFLLVKLVNEIRRQDAAGQGRIGCGPGLVALQLAPQKQQRRDVGDAGAEGRRGQQGERPLQPAVDHRAVPGHALGRRAGRAKDIDRGVGVRDPPPGRTRQLGADHQGLDEIGLRIVHHLGGGPAGDGETHGQSGPDRAHVDPPVNAARSWTRGVAEA